MFLYSVMRVKGRHGLSDVTGRNLCRYTHVFSAGARLLKLLCSPAGEALQIVGFAVACIYTSAGNCNGLRECNHRFVDHNIVPATLITSTESPD